MEKEKRLNFIFAYLSWVLGLALLQFWMQSQADFFSTVGLNVFMLVFACLFIGGAIYLQHYFKQMRWYYVVLLIVFYLLSYLLILALAVVFFVTLDASVQAQINLSVYETWDVLLELGKNLPVMLWRMVTFQDCHHYLDFIYAILIEVGFFCPLLLLVKKKDCTDDKKCV